MMILMTPVTDPTNIDPRDIPVVYNIHRSPWPNAYGNTRFYIPEFQLLMPTPDVDPIVSPFLFTTYEESQPSAGSNLVARINVNFDITNYTPPEPDMKLVPAKFASSLAIHYLDAQNQIVEIHLQTKTEVFGNRRIVAMAQATGALLPLSYSALSGRSSNGESAYALVGLSSIKAYVPTSVTLPDINNPTYHFDLLLGDTPDLRQYQLYEISGFVMRQFPLLVPCSTMGNLYRHWNGDGHGWTLIGCQSQPPFR